jgi:hypothetical protein
VRIVKLMTPLLETEGLTVQLPTPGGWVRPDSGSFPVFVSIADKRLTSLATDCALLLGTDSGGQLTDGGPRLHASYLGAVADLPGR